MATSVTFNTTYTGNQVTEGVYASVVDTYLGSQALSTGSSLTMTGSIAKVGDTLTVASKTGGVLVSTTTATYVGSYTQLGSNSLYYVFQDGVLGTSFAVSSTGLAVPLLVTAAILTTGAIPVCFLAGTHIATPDGETVVEALAVGDMVATQVDGESVFAPVTWIGRGRMVVTRPNDIEEYPVRIRANAFGPLVPHRDLLVTSEHCLFVDGKLIPARMLVNGGSILVDTGITEYEFFHVELAAHAILLAEGLEAESYLDTGNRNNFVNAAITALHPDFSVDPAHKSWANDAAAPLAVDRATVEPIWNRLADRAAALGLTCPLASVATAADPDLRLVTESGLVINPTLYDGKVYAFVVPGGASTLRLLSRSARPSEMIGPFVDDRRALGVLVGRVGFSESRRRNLFDAHLSGAAMQGWHTLEAGSPGRWTDGDAELAIDLSSAEGRPVFLDIEVLQISGYDGHAIAA